MIHRKLRGQSAIAVKKEAGISYVKATESKQHKVGHIYRELAPTVFQCSYNISPSKCKSVIDGLYKNLFGGDSPLIIAYFESHYEEFFKSFLLNPENRLQSLQNHRNDQEGRKEGIFFADKGTGLMRLGRFCHNEGFLVILLKHNKDAQNGIISSACQGGITVPG